SALEGRFRGHIDGCLVGGPVAMDFPALWENKALGAAPWKEVVKKGVVLARPLYAAQIALYQAYLELPNWRCSPRSIETRSSCTASWFRSMRHLPNAPVIEPFRSCVRAKRRSSCRAPPPTKARPS